MNLLANKVFVTGVPGWLGTSLVQALVHGLAECEPLRDPQPGLTVRCLALPDQDVSVLKTLANVEVVPGDVRSADDCRRFLEGARDGLLFHTAGVIHPRRVAEFHRVNVEGTKNLLSVAVEAGVRRAVVVSSNSPCGCNPHPEHRFDESSPYHPYQGYGRSKMRMEQLVQELEKAGKVETVIVRPPWFYGPNQPPRQTLFFQMVRDGKMPLVGDGSNRRSMAYIDNLCQGLLLAGSVASARGQIYWIADERPYTMVEIIDTVERLLEKEFGQACTHKRMKLPGFASRVARLADTVLQGVGVYNQKIHVLSEMNQTIACSVAKAQNELGYRPTVALEEGMRRSIRWCFSQGLLP